MSTFHERAARELREERPAATLTPIMRKLVNDSVVLLARTTPDARQRAADARAYAVAHIEELHAQVRTQFEARGIGYHRAATAAEAVETIAKLLGDAKRVPKSKTMVGEEVGLTHALRSKGIDILETDIGEYIVDIEGRGPSHITAPAIHLNRDRIKALLERSGMELEDNDPTRLSQAVRDVVGDFFKDCDAAITGANLVIASSGRLGIVENEGNVSLGVSHPKLHIAITGIEKVVADEAAALAIFQVLAPSATGQPLTSFTHFVADPLPGQQRHVVFVDNGRSRIQAEARYRDVLKCIRCGACMNGCPIYRIAGGLSYQSPYMGPIGAVLSPLLFPSGGFQDLPFASSLCGRCTEVCPVGIPLHRMLLDLRGDAVEAGRVGTRKERLAWKGWALAFGGATRARVATTVGRLGLRGGGRFRQRDAHRTDPRLIPDPSPTRDPANLRPAVSYEPIVPVTPVVSVVSEFEVQEEEGLEALFRSRCAALGVEVVNSFDAFALATGDIVLDAAAGIASTGSVLLLGEATLRRPLLAAKRTVIRLRNDQLVRYPTNLVDRLGDGEALILTGASRTADIEKIIVRGIHGPETMVVVLQA